MSSVNSDMSSSNTSSIKKAFNPNRGSVMISEGSVTSVRSWMTNELRNWYMFRTEGRFEASRSFGTSRSFETSGSFVVKLSISVTDPVTNGKAKVMKWMFKGVKVFLHVKLNEYIHVALSEGLLITGKEGLAYMKPWEASS
ncbi:hypothetical protein Tco_0454378 [Tanacetum coccineum]